ncbi:MAG: isovaleryl-CoA dehydrogenase [Candidatus Hydrogenedentes bacterium]|nr:isovaleryl-CoA dehydrogenase [Candidatus Hydrogenedentota bacterium]
MNFDLTHEQIELQQKVRAFARREVAPLAAEIDRDERFPAATFKKLGEMGLLGLMVPKEYGGMGESVLTCCLVAEELAHACAPTTMSYLAHAVLCCHNLLCNGSDAQRQKYLPALASGAALGAIAMTEPNSGSDVLSMQTFAECRNGEYVINGTKTYITNAPVANTFLVYARTDKTLGPRGISQFIVERGFPGFTVGTPFSKMGMRGSPTAPLHFENCRVPAENLVKEENQALGILMGGLDVERTVGAALGLGLARAAYDMALAHATQREQFGQPLIMFEMITEKIANMSMEIEAARMLMYKAAVLCGRHVRCSLEASHAKLFSSEVGARAAIEAQQILGGIGYMKDCAVERLVRDSRLGTIGGGTSEIQRLIIARETVRRSM